MLTNNIIPNKNTYYPFIILIYTLFIALYQTPDSRFYLQRPALRKMFFGQPGAISNISCFKTAPKASEREITNRQYAKITAWPLTCSHIPLFQFFKAMQPIKTYISNPILKGFLIFLCNSRAILYPSQRSGQGAG